MWDAIKQVNEISPLIVQAGCFNNLKATTQALAMIGNPDEVLKRVKAIDLVKGYVAQHLDLTHPDEGHDQTVRDGGTEFLVDTLFQVPYIALNEGRNEELRPAEREVEAEGQEAECEERFLASQRGP